jgi:hypothetical protein
VPDPNGSLWLQRTVPLPGASLDGLRDGHLKILESLPANEPVGTKSAIFLDDSADAM